MSPVKELCVDILQPVPFEEWPLLQELLKADWPKYSFYYYWITNTIKWKKLDQNLALQIYSPQGKYQDDVTFVGISSFAQWTVVVFTKEPSGKRLHEALMQTSRIDWSKGITFSAVHDHMQSILHSALTTLRTDQGIEIDKCRPNYLYIKSADECANVEVKVPEECYLRDLRPSDLFIIHSLWVIADKKQPETTMNFLRVSITLNNGIGLFLKERDVLVSWAIHNDWHGLGVVQTLDAYKRRGYGKVVVNALAKQLGKEGISPVLSVICGNAPSENMFRSLNWKLNSLVTWVLMKKYLPSVK